MSEKKNSHVIMLRLAAVLLVLVMLSTSMVAGRYARYVTQASASDSARVAMFRVTETGELIQAVGVKIHPGQKVPITVRIVNDSEVAVEYTVDARNESNNLLLDFDLIQDPESETPVEVESVALAPGETKEFALQIYWRIEDNGVEHIGMVDRVYLTVKVTQID